LRSFKCPPSQTVLCYSKFGPNCMHLSSEIGRFGRCQPPKLGDNHRGCRFKRLMQRRNHFLFLDSVQCWSPRFAMEHSKPPTAVAFWAPLKPTNPISSVREVQATNNLEQTKVWPQYFGGNHCLCRPHGNSTFVPSSELALAPAVLDR